MTQTNWKILAATTTGSFFANVDAALETYLKTSGPSSGVVGALGAAFITGTYETWPGLAGTTATRFPIILVNTSGGANRTEAGANAECSCVTEIRICDSNANARAAASAAANANASSRPSSEVARRPSVARRGRSPAVPTAFDSPQTTPIPPFGDDLPHLRRLSCAAQRES